MPIVPPTAPTFGEPLPVQPSPETLAFLGRRRSASALSLSAPGPTAIELDSLLGLAMRVPDHGKLSPWRFIVLQGDAKAQFVTQLETIGGARADATKVLPKLGKISTPPVTVVVVSRPRVGDIPIWEQELSAGAVCLALIIAAQAKGYGANWITDWYAYDAEANARLGLSTGERVAGYVHLGTCAQPPLERVRPDIATLVSHWAP